MDRYEILSSHIGADRVEDIQATRDAAIASAKRIHSEVGGSIYVRDAETNAIVWESE